MKKEQQQISPGIQPGDSISPLDIDDAVKVLRNLCALASTAIGVSRDRSERCQSIDDLEQRIQLLKYLIDRMGWVADVALRKLGHAGLLARPEDWMMPDV